MRFLQVVLIGKHVIQKVVLPQVAIGSYWISDKSKGMEKKLINIEGKDGSWQILSNNSIKIINNKYINLAARELNLGASKLQDAVIDKVILKEYAMYPICIGDSKEVYILYCTPVSENNLVKLTAKQINEILIGSSKCKINI